MRSLRRQQMDMFAPERITPSIPAQQKLKLIPLIQEILRETMAASAALQESEQTREVSDEQGHA